MYQYSSVLVTETSLSVLCQVLYLLVAPYDNEAIDLLHKVKATESKYIEKIPCARRS